MVKFPVSGGVGFCLISEADLSLVGRFSWTMDKHGYVCTYDLGRRPVFMHRMIVGLSKCRGRHVHHVNGLRADNRRENLRIMSRGEHLALKRRIGGEEVSA